ncbi:hypothetical protein F2981_23060 (plasmid) [Sinorhizobium meliloti]|nr:hypothetical protein [Sinorhizobium meliloti]
MGKARRCSGPISRTSGDHGHTRSRHHHISRHAPRPRGCARFRAGLIESAARALDGLYTIVSLVGPLSDHLRFLVRRVAKRAMLYDPPIFPAPYPLLLMLVASSCLRRLPAGWPHRRRALKHPQVLSIKIWALCALLANGEHVLVLLFGPFAWR